MLTERISNAIDIFLDAINEGTLAKGDCTKCAIGNLVRKGMGLSKEEYCLGKLRSLGDGSFINWSLIFSTNNRFNYQKNKPQKFNRDNYKAILVNYPLIKEQIDSTEFTVEELAKIENTFEKNTKIWFSDYIFHSKEKVREDQIRGLEAVVRVMMEFDNCEDNVKEVFTSKAELIEV